MDGFPSLVPSRKRSSCRPTLLFGVALSILGLGIGCGDFTLYGNDNPSVCDPDPCASTDNAMAGTCTADGESDYECDCQSGYFWEADGNTCEDPCASDPCDTIDNAVVSSCEGVDVNDYTCECDAGFVWNAPTDSCEVDPCDPDPCDEARNEVVGSCTALGGDDYTCGCDAGYFWEEVGNTCEDPCASDPCDSIPNAERGSCAGIDANDYTCDCDTGYTWNGQINQCTSEAVGTCDDLKDCLGDCTSINDYLCLSSCYGTWTGCDCVLDTATLIAECAGTCLLKCIDVESKACWDCALACGFDTQCQ
jgi:hypothetical protein